jgi:hypothetical protein
MLKSVSQPQPVRGETSRSTFVRNMVLPIHGWYRFSAGFSADWVESLIRSRKELVEDLAVLDPFAGVGTAVLAAESAGTTVHCESRTGEITLAFR